jgi:drug/metabolite transporter (DMT)-like permease
MTGILAGLAAGALWALAFIAPELVAPAGAAELTIVRYTVFGVSSVAVLAFLPGERWLPLLRTHWMALVLLSLLGNTVYYMLLATAIQMAGVFLPAFIIGTLPVVMAVAGARRDGAFDPRRLALPSVLILGGLLLHTGLPDASTGSNGQLPAVLTGAFLAAGALVSWALYGIRNAELLQRLPQVDLTAWTALTGALTLLTLPVLLLPVIIPGVPGPGPSSPLASGDGAAATVNLIFWGSVLGLLSSWGATWLWNLASRSLKTSQLGYLIVSETVFSIAYAYIMDWRMPGIAEVASVAMLTAGVCHGLGVNRRKALA